MPSANKPNLDAKNTQKFYSWGIRCAKSNWHLLAYFSQLKCSLPKPKLQKNLEPFVSTGKEDGTACLMVWCIRSCGRIRTYAKLWNFLSWPVESHDIWTYYSAIQDLISDPHWSVLSLQASSRGDSDGESFPVLSEDARDSTLGFLCAKLVC